MCQKRTQSIIQSAIIELRTEGGNVQGKFYNKLKESTEKC